jgi:hypothetical protein
MGGRDPQRAATVYWIGSRQHRETTSNVFQAENARTPGVPPNCNLPLAWCISCSKADAGERRQTSPASLRNEKVRGSNPLSSTPAKATLTRHNVSPH